MILLSFPDGRKITLDDEQARHLADILWGMAMAQQRQAAVVAVGIQQALRRAELSRRPVEIPAAVVDRVDAGLLEVRQVGPLPVSEPDAVGQADGNEAGWDLDTERIDG